MSPIELTAPVTHVTVLEDRAEVRRTGRLTLSAGRTILCIEGVAPVLADKTLRAEAPGVTITDLRVLREPRILLDDREERLAACERELRAHEAATARLQHRIAEHQREEELLGHAQHQYLRDLEGDVAWGTEDADRWRRELVQLSDIDASLRQATLALRLELEEAQRTAEDLVTRRNALNTASSSMGARIQVVVVAEAETSTELTLHYLVPGAAWRPRHEAMLTGDSLAWSTHGCIWQNTGEDWVDVHLSLSTQRPSMGAEPPHLAEDRLRAVPKSEVVLQARDQTLETTGVGLDAEVSKSLPGIDDGGEVRTLQPAEPCTIRSDGALCSVPLFGFVDPETSEELVCMPELASAVLRSCRVVNKTSQPLLAGPVELIREGGHVGRAPLGFIAAGAGFDLGFGPDPAVRVHRHEESVTEEPGMLNRWRTTRHRVRLKLSNTGDEPKVIKLVERVPVSEVEQVHIKVDRKKTHEGKQPDADGMLRWSITLDPRAHEQLELVWSEQRSTR